MPIVGCLLILLLMTGCSERPSLLLEESPAQIRQLLAQGSQAYEDEQYDEALQTFQKALSVVTPGNHPQLTADVYYRLGRVQLQLQRYDEALASFNHALDVLKRVNRRQDEAVLHHAMGDVYHTLGEVALAKAHYTQALHLRQKAGDKLGAARTRANLASIALDEGRYVRALELYESVRTFLEHYTPRVPQDIGAILTDIGALYSELGQYEKAVEFHERAVKAYEEAEERRAVAAALHNLGVTYFHAQDYAAAIHAFERALASRQPQDRLGRAKTLNSLGLTLAEAQHEAQGLKALNEALDIVRLLHSRRYEAATLDSLGSVYKKRGDYSTAKSHYHWSLVIWLQLGEQEGARVTLSNLGLLHRELQQPEVAIFYLKRAVNASQRLRAGGKGLEQALQRSLTKRLENPYRVLAELLIEQGRLPEAEQVLALLKEREQLEFVRSDAIREPSTSEASMTSRERTLAAWLDASTRKLSDIHAKMENMEKLRRKRALSPEEERAWERFGAQFSVENGKVRSWLRDLQKEVARPRDSEIIDTGFDTAGLLKQLEKDTRGEKAVLIYFLPSAHATTFLISTQQGLLAHHAGLGEKQLNTRIEALREALGKRDDSYRPIAAELYDALIRPLEAELSKEKVGTLMLYLTSTLRYLPFAALYDTASRAHLVEKYALVLYTSVARAHLTAPPSTAPWSAVALGTSRKIGNYDPLPAVRYELAHIVRDPRDKQPEGILKGKRYLDEEFSRKVFERLLDADTSFPVMHIATHFMLRPGSDENSTLLLGDAQEMTLGQIRARARMSGYELVTLSACNTAIGNIVPALDTPGIGAEVEGLGTILQQHGAKAVLATLWKVQDTGTARLMEEFYRTRGAERRTTKADALRQAQLALLRGHVKADTPSIALTHPYYWAPFVLMGNWL